MAEYHPKTEKLQLTEHDVLGDTASRYNMEDIALDGPEPPVLLNVGNGYSDSFHKASSKTDRVLLTLFGITTDDLEGLGKILIACAVVSVLVLVGLLIHIFFGPPQVEPHGAVAADNGKCSEIGVNILKSGGSAVDATIAALFCLQVVNPQSAGMGGGGFGLVYNHKTKLSYYLDFRETAPAAFEPAMRDELDGRRILAIGVPGELRGLYDLYMKFGTMRWKDLVLPAAELARSGFPVTESLVEAMWRFNNYKDQPSSTRLGEFLFPGGKALQAGQIIKRPEFADVLEKIAYNGVNEFYTGSLADEMITEIKKYGGILAKDDLANYTVRVRQPLLGTYKGFSVLTAPPPSAAPSLLLSLNMLENLGDNETDIQTSIYWHKIIETLKFAHANRQRLGDPDFEPTVNKAAIEMMQKPYAQTLWKQIKNDSVLSSYGTDIQQPEPHGTTHVSAVDTNELYVSITSSINGYFGSGLMTPSGIVLNNQLNDFASPNMSHEAQANLPLPGKRPLSSMSPAIVFHPQRTCGSRISVGASNGSQIPSGVLHTILNILLHRMNVSEAIEAPRVFADKPENLVQVESHLGHSIVEELKTYGHNVTVINEGLSVVQSVMRRNRTISAHSDSRKNGQADIY